MKLLILGLDGGDLKVLEKFNMPFLHSLIKKNTSVDLKEDLFSRGWAEIISGKHARETGAFYMRPKIDGTHDYTESYSLSDLKKNSPDPLIWEVAENRGMKVGIMNVPTTYPASRVNGFFVSGAGGGLNQVNDIPAEMCSDNDVKKTLEKNNYIIDIRLPTSGIKRIDVIFERLGEMIKQRTNAFIELNKINGPDFVFFAFRSIVILVNLAMYEINAIRGKKGDYSRFWKNKLDKFFLELDENIERIFKNANPDNFILVSDHGAAVQEFNSNYNVFLENKNYLSRRLSLKDGLIYPGKKMIAFVASLFGYKLIISRQGKIDWSRTKVFGYWNINGLYVNDKKRFRGIVSEEEVDTIVDQVVDEFNNTLESKKYNLHARPYRKNYKESKFYDFLPDIWIDAPDNIFFRTYKDFISKNPWFSSIKNLKYLQAPTFISGKKGSKPLCVISNNLAQFVSNEDKKDLTLVYKIVERYINSL